jgi:hypothetical protein
MEQHQTIIGLWRQGWSYRRIAAERGIDRDTVSRHVKAAGRPVEPQPADAGQPDGRAANAAISIAGSFGSGLDPVRVQPGATSLAGGANAAISIAGSADSHSGPANASARVAPAFQSNAAISITGSTVLATGDSTGGHAGDWAAPGGAPVIGGADGLSSVGTTSIGEAAPLPPAEAAAGRRSLCEPLRAAIIAGLELGLTARRIWQDLRADHDFAGDYQSVQRFVRGLRKTSPLPFRRMECEPGAEAQIDFGIGAPIVTPEGKRTRPHLFRIVLSQTLAHSPMFRDREVK